MIELLQARHRARNLRDILLRERELLRRGRFQELSEIEGLTEQAMDALLSTRREVARRIESDIRAIQADAAHNKILLAAALTGVTSARDQINEMAAQSDGLGVYDSAGHRVDLPVRSDGKLKRY